MSVIFQLLGFVRKNPLLQIFTIYLRYLIGGAFVIAAFGMGKFNDHQLLISAPGTPIQDLLPIQQFFRVMATSGLYWHFIGLMQVLSGALLMTQRLAKLGALIFFGLILNIFIITVSYHFIGTPVITGLMLLASIYLLMWDLDSFQFIFRSPSNIKHHEAGQGSIITNPYWAIVGVVMLATVILLALLHYYLPFQLLVCFIEGLIAFGFYFLVKPYRKSLQQQ